MTASPTHEGDPPVGGVATAEQLSGAYEFEITLSRDRPAECTIYPRDGVATERPTAWVTATEGSFVGLEGVR